MEGLRATAEAGRVAESVLRDLERQGFSDKTALWLEQRKTGLAIRRTSFPRAPDPSREDFPYSEMSLVTKNPFHEKHGHISHRCLELWLQGYRVTPGPEFVEDRIKVGHVRFHTSGPRASIVGAPIVEMEDGIVHEHKWGGWVVNVKKASRLRDRLHFAHIVAFHMCGNRPTDPYVAEMSRRLPIWLCEDGITGRWMVQLQDMARKRLVVEAVLGG